MEWLDSVEGVFTEGPPSLGIQGAHGAHFVGVEVLGGGPEWQDADLLARGRGGRQAANLLLGRVQILLVEAGNGGKGLHSKIGHLLLVDDRHLGG